MHDEMSAVFSPPFAISALGKAPFKTEPPMGKQNYHIQHSPLLAPS
jgi:hypothetical protein